MLITEFKIYKNKSKELAINKLKNNYKFLLKLKIFLIKINGLEKAIGNHLKFKF